MPTLSYGAAGVLAVSGLLAYVAQRRRPRRPELLVPWALFDAPRHNNFR